MKTCPLLEKKQGNKKTGLPVLRERPSSACPVFWLTGKPGDAKENKPGQLN